MPRENLVELFITGRLTYGNRTEACPTCGADTMLTIAWPSHTAPARISCGRGHTWTAPHLAKHRIGHEMPDYVTVWSEPA